MKWQPWQIAALPFGVIAIICFTIAFLKSNEQAAVWGIIPFVILAGIYVMSPQVNWLWYKRNPPSLDPNIQRFIDDNFLYYKKLSPELKTTFRERMSLYMLGNEFMRPPRMDQSDEKGTVPEDLKAAVAAHAVQVNFGKYNVLTGKYEHIVVYPHPFSTPQYQHFHTTETYDDDGVLLFTADQLISGMMNPQRYFSIGLYEYARVFKKLYPTVTYPHLTDDIWLNFEQITSMTRQFIESVVGLYDIDVFGVAAHHFFSFPERFHSALPDLYQLLSNIFNQNPMNGAHPILSD
jgi:MtfA peptidase